MRDQRKIRPLGHQAGQRSLNAMLKLLGYTTKPAAFKGCKDVFHDGRLVYMGTADDVWKWLKRTKQISS
jgi:hypothetical protein